MKVDRLLMSVYSLAVAKYQIIALLCLKYFMKSNKTRKPGKLNLNLKPTPELIFTKSSTSSRLLNLTNQKLFLLTAGLLLISISLLGLVGYALGQKRAQLDQSNSLALNSSNQFSKTQVLGAVELSQTSLPDQTKDMVPIQDSKADTVQSPDQNTKALVNQGDPDEKITTSGQVATSTKAQENQNQTIAPKKDIKNQIDLNAQPKQEIDPAQGSAKPQTNFKNLTPNDFHQILLDHIFENTKSGGDLLSATGLAAADERINQIAQSRGFQRWPEAAEDQLVEVKPNIKLLPKAKQAFLEMVEAAKKDQVVISLNSGYRSQSDQNSIFQPRYQALEFAELGGNYTPEELSKGEGDDLLNRIMTVTAPPGYSRHHTGYTVDLVDLSPDNTSQNFKNSKAAKWLSQNNFANARRFGFIPSYPEGLDGVGPQPEAWEYVWVGDAAK